MFCVLIFFFEVTRAIIAFEPITKDVESVAKGGVYYHAAIAIQRYFVFLLKLGGYLFGASAALGLIGFFTFKEIQGDIMFTIFLIICLILFLIFAQRTLTPDMEKLIVQKRRQQIEDELLHSHKKYS